MLKAGVFLDVENLRYNGGWGMRFEILKRLAEAQGTTVLRMNAYLAVDHERERNDPEYGDKAQSFRDRVRRSGIHIVQKPVKKFISSDGSVTVKANADLDLAVDAILQAENLDYVLLGTGDGDFLRLVRALQNKGKRVDVLAFENVSRELRREADYYFHGAMIPDLLPFPDDAKRDSRGILHTAKEDRGFGFITMRTGYGITDVRDNIFCHISSMSIDGRPVSNELFADMALRDQAVEFSLVADDEGKPQATNVVPLRLTK